MRLARFSVDDRVAYGIVEGDVDDASSGIDDAEIAVIAGHPFAPFEFTGERIRMSRARLLAPVLPSKVMAFAKTYADHAREMGGETPADPVMFLKPSTAVVGPGNAIVLPALSSEVHHEAELAVVIGRLCREVPHERAHEVILGYTCANDVTARDLQRSDGQWSRAKGFDTFCPLGPWIETDLDPADVTVECRVDGEVRQSGRTADLAFSVADLVVWASAAMTLLPGDVILTGTPAGVGPIVAGNVVEVTVGGIGTLRNQVITA
jgi:2-keto-4-pentenoate hydratase/2-oxohepta-3-ene-1,7-dioic acid hydratase in catechol pathway